VISEGWSQITDHWSLISRRRGRPPLSKRGHEHVSDGVAA